MWGGLYRGRLLVGWGEGVILVVGIELVGVGLNGERWVRLGGWSGFGGGLRGGGS